MSISIIADGKCVLSCFDKGRDALTEKSTWNVKTFGPLKKKFYFKMSPATILTHISLASFLWDIIKGNSADPDQTPH